jgi:integrase
MPTKFSMKALVRRYLAHRRGFGYGLKTQRYDLAAFARYADRVAPGQPLTVSLALRWAKRGTVLPVTVANRLSTVRGLARFCSALDPRTQVPPKRLTHSPARRRAPHIFTDAQLKLILRRTRKLSPWRTCPLRSLTYQTLIGLIACTGLRLGEALRLQDEHLDPVTGTLTVPAVKCSPGRLLPLDPTTVRALKHYQDKRKAQFPVATRFFVGPIGRPLETCSVDRTFRRLVRGIPCNGARHSIRLYDLRHTLATKLIDRWSRQSMPLAHRLVMLSEYLGHKYFHHTYWYVQHQRATLEAAAVRFERYHAEQLPC